MLSWLARRADSELVLVVSLDSSSGSRSCRKSLSGLITDLGFAAGPGQPIITRQPREKKADSWVLHDRFSIHQDDGFEGVGWVELREKLAYDLHYRSEVPWTGIHACIHLSVDTMGKYETYLGRLEYAADAIWPESEEWSGLIFRFPVLKFPMPMRRGGLDPKVDERRVGKLREIRKFKIDRMTVQKLQTVEGDKSKAIDGLPEDSGNVSPPLLIEL